MATIIFFTSDNIISKIIGFFENSPISHAAIGLEIDGKQMCLQALCGGVQLLTREDSIKTDKIYAEYKIIPCVGDEIKLAEGKIGEPYDTLGLIGYIFVLLARDFNIGIHNPLASKSATVCSEFVVELDVEHKIPEFIGLDPTTITPADLFLICSEGRSFEKI